MAPFRSLLGRKNQPNGREADGFDENHLSPNPRAAPIGIRRSNDGEPNEYKLSGMIGSCDRFAMRPGRDIANGTVC